MTMRFKKVIAAAALLGAAGLALAPALAQDNVYSNENKPKPAVAAKKTVDVACVKTAITKRDGAIAAAWTAKSAAIGSAMTARTAALLAAWDITVAKDKAAAVKSAWSAYNTAVRGANKAMRTARQGAWSAFTKERRACNAPANFYETVGQNADAQL